MILFLTVAFVGFLLVAMSVLFGGDGDFEIGEMAGDIDHGGSPGVLNLKVIAMALCGWGVAGGIAHALGAERMMASIIGIGGAVVLGGVGLVIMKLFYGSQAPFSIGDADYVGIIGRTLYDIPKDGLGQIICNIKGTSLTLMAKVEKGQKLSKDTIVEIISKQGGMVIVKEKKDAESREVHLSEGGSK